MQVKTLAPIFFGKTQSFWFAIFPAILTAIDFLTTVFNGSPENAPVATIIAGAISMIFPAVTAAKVFGFMQSLTIVTTFAGVYFRRGYARPLVATPGAEVSQSSAVLVKQVSAAAAEGLANSIAAKLPGVVRR